MSSRATRRSITLAGCALIALPLFQVLAERFVPLPLGPSRMLTIALCSLALIPIARAALERVAGAALTRGARVATVVLVPLLAVAHLLAFARLGDGPFGPVPGGPFEAAAVAPPVDWSGAADLRYAELEVDSAKPRTLETVLVVHEGGLYVAANMPESKRWPRTVRQEGKARVRLGGAEVYALRARFVESPEQTRSLLQAMIAKYRFDLSMGGPIWFFELEPQKT